MKCSVFNYVLVFAFLTFLFYVTGYTNEVTVSMAKSKRCKESTPVCPLPCSEIVENFMKSNNLEHVVWISRIVVHQENDGVTMELMAQTISSDKITLDDAFLYSMGLSAIFWDCKGKEWNPLIQFKEDIAPCYSIEPNTTQLTCSPQKISFYYSEAEIAPDAFGVQIIQLLDSIELTTKQGMQTVLLFGCMYGIVSCVDSECKEESKRNKNEK